jgi:predicted ester cyclase
MAAMATRDLAAAFSEVTVDVDRVVEDRERCLAWIRIRGIHTGRYLGLSPTGKAIDVVATVEAPRRAPEEARIDMDRLEIFAQLGAVNLPGPSGERTR